MSVRLQRLLGAATLLLFAPLAGAAITCTVSVTAMLTVYDPISPTLNVITGSYRIDCTRNAPGTDPTTLAWSLGLNNGSNFSNPLNTKRVQRTGSQRYSYGTYRASPYNAANEWTDVAGSTRFTGTINFGAGATAFATGPFDMVMTAGQAVQPAGIYTDTLTATLRTGATTLATNSFGVAVRTDNWCHFSVSPGTMAFTYTSFQLGTANASTSFGIRCTTGVPYTMALDATSGILLGLTYNLSLPTTSSSGTGETQTHNINGTIAGGQSGTCAGATCNGSQTRTLTLTW
jgi:spore coat protein U-like protein